MNIKLIDHVFRSLESTFTSAIPSGGQHGRKSAICGAHELPGGSSPTADLRTAEVGSLPVTRYWTVKYECAGRTFYDYVEACDAWKAGLVVFRRHDGATSTQVVREIDRDEFQHLTRVSP